MSLEGETMGLFDLFVDKEKAEQKRLRKLKKTLTHMYVQAAERQYAVEQLRELSTAEATAVLLARFQETNPNHTTDADEKEYVFQVLVDLGRRGEVDVVQVVVDHLKAIEENINWPLKVLIELVSPEKMVEVVIELLSEAKLGYQRNPEKKRELMLRAGDFKDRALAEALTRFLGDDNETIRFLAVDALMAQEEEDIAKEPMIECLCVEDSLRTQQKLAEIFAERPQWRIPEERKEEVEANLPKGFGVHRERHVYRKRN
jgi:hypothetical protein